MENTIGQLGQFGMDNPTLGAPTAEYRSGAVRPVFTLLFGFILGSLGVSMILFSTSSAQAADEDRVPILIIGGFLAAFGWLLVELSLRARGQVVTVFADGLTRTQYGKTLTLRWEEITSVWQQVTKHYYNGVYTGTTHVYTVQKTDSTKIKFNDAVKNVEQLGNTIQDEVTQRLLPLAITSLSSGETITFGKLGINVTGLTWGDKSLLWSEIEGVQINKGVLSIKKQGKWLKWANITVSSIPNLLIALTLINRMTEVNGKK